MIDNFALALTHGLLLLVAWRLIRRPDLDKDGIAPPAAPERVKTPFVKAKPGA